MTAPRALFLWDVAEDLRRHLEARLAGVVELIFAGNADEDELMRLAPSVAMMVGWRPPLEFLRAASKLGLFVNPGAGVHHLLPVFRELAAERSILLTNSHGNAGHTAQHAVALLLALCNRVVSHHEWMKEGRWRTGDEDASSIPLQGRTVGLLGYGAINHGVRDRLSGFGVSFVGLRRSAGVRGDDSVEWFERDRLSEFLDRADVLMVAVPLTDETRGLIGAEELRRLGPRGIVVNVARGDVIDEEALYRALRDRTIEGAAIDVWYDYRPEPDPEGRRYPYRHPFHELDNVILSPHRGASPMDDLDRWDDVIENLRRYAEGRRDLLNVVDLVRGY